jgi:two-component system, chemotaxis family, sensor kinase CheA
VLGLALRSGVVSSVRERARTAETATNTGPSVDTQTVLLFAARGGGRMAVPLSLVARLEEFPRSAVERVGTQDVVQYRNEILPLIHVSRVLNRQLTGARSEAKTTRPTTMKSDTVAVVVHSGQGRSVGLVVGRILDIVEATVVYRSKAERPGVLFTAVVQDRVTEFLDVEAIVHAADAEIVGMVTTPAGK